MILRRVLLASVSSYANKLVAITIAFVLVPFLLHRLGDAQYGLWILISSIVANGELLDVGIGPAIAKYVAEYHAERNSERANGLIATAFSLYTVLGLVALVLAVALAYMFAELFAIPPSEHGTAATLVLLLGAQLAISMPCTTFAAILRGLQRYDLLNAVSIFGQITSASATVIIVLCNGGVIEIVAANLLIWSATQIMNIRCIRRVAPEFRLGWRGARLDLVRTVAVFSSSMFAIHAAGRVQTKVDEIVIGARLSAAVVAPYAIARQLSGIPQLICEQFLKVFIPLSSQLNAEGDRYRIQLLYVIGSRVTLAILMPIGGVLVTVAGPLLTAWVGPSYAGYAPICVILTLASLIETSQWPGMLILQGIAQHHRLAAAWVCAATANLALSLMLVRTHGAIGVAVGTLVPTTAVCFGFVLPHAMQIIGIPFRDMLKKVFLPTLVPAVPMAIVLYSAGQISDMHSLLSIMSTASLAVMVYMAGYLGLAGDYERQTLNEFMKKVRKVLHNALVRPIHS
jgi:O-antigen/teichoic acid export membrane protein